MAIVARVGLVVIASLLALYAASLLTAATVGQDRYVQVARQAAADGTLGRTTALPLAPAVARPVFNFNDCLILSMLVLPPRDHLSRRALSPSIPVPGTVPGAAPPGYPPFPHCAELAAALDNPAMPSGYYHRYLHGDWVLAGALLAVLPFQTATTLLFLTVCGLLGTLMLFSAYGVWRGLAASRPRDVAFLVLAGFVALFYALPVYGRSLSFAPSDIVLLGFVLFTYLRPLPGLTERAFVTTVALFGTLTAIFEFLIGAIPAGLVVLLAMLVLDPSRPVALRRIGLGVACYIGAIALAFLLKALVIAALWGWPEVIGSGGLFARHFAQAGWAVAPDNLARLEALGFAPDAIKSSYVLSALYGLIKIVYFSPLVGLGSMAVGVAVVVVLPLALVIRGLWCAWRTSEPMVRRRELLLIAAACVMPAWYVVLTTHTIVHAFFMVRPMVWPAAVLLAGVCALGFSSRSAASHPR